MSQVRSNVAVAQTNLAYIYDDLNRLEQATRPLVGDPDETFQYDPVGNRLSRDGQAVNSVFDDANRLLDDSTFTYTYDVNGNLTQKIDETTGKVTEYTWDVQNQLVKVEERPNLADPPTKTINYKYDAVGRRIQKDVDGTLTKYIYDGLDILLEYDGANVLQARYTHGPGIDEPLVMNRGGVDYFYQVDGLGSITELTDSTGIIAQSYVYDSFGNINVFDQAGAMITPVGGISNPFTYTGREFDTETKLYYYRARYYDSRVGRFISEDPIDFGGGDVNLYGYTLSDPINKRDPMGLYVWGVNVGGTVTKNGVKAGTSTAILFDSDGNFAIVTTQEAGVGKGNSAGLFDNIVFGDEHTKVSDYAGEGISASGTYKKLTGSATLPFGPDGGPPKTFYEAGIAPWSLGGNEAGVTMTFGQVVYETSIMGDSGRWWGDYWYDLFNPEDDLCK